MSTTVDNRVLEMRFDNKQFESGVATSMSTLEKLKQKLNLSGASKGLENIGKVAKNVSFSGLVAGAEEVNVRFSHMQMSIQHQLDKIVDSCIHAGKKMASALTIDPIKSGFQEYETQINAVQTILANTQSKGTTLDQVNAALDELNMYADKTIYNFTEMTKNIGTFTAAGVDLETSVSSIQGIANLAAISGSTSQQASTAMYQLSQALAAGKVQLMDWNSVVNAGMGGQVFQDALKKTSELLGTGAEAAIKAKGSFRESLREGWLTAEVLTQTLQKMTTSGANEYVAEYTGLTVEAVEAAVKDAKAKYGEADAIKEASKALAEKSGKNAEEIEETLQMAKTAEEAATKVKTFSQLIDTLKEALQSGWTQTWEILVGDFEEAKELFTGISDTIGEFINKTAESRNTILEGSMTSNWDKLIQKVNEAGVDTDTFNEKVKAIAKDGGVNVDKLITKYGSLEKAFQDGAISSDILTKALKDISGAVTELEGTFRIGDGMTEASDDVKKLQTALEKAGFTLTEFGVDGKFGKETEAAVKAFQKAKGLAEDGIVGPETLKALKESSGVTGKLADDVFELAKNVDQIGGRQHIIEGFKNAFKGLTSIFTAIGKAWEGVFPSGTIEERTAKVLKLTESFHKFSEKLIPTEETANNITRTFKGLFAVLDIISTILGGGLKFGFKALSAILGAFDSNVLELTAGIGDALVAFRDFLFSGNAIAKVIDGLIAKLPGAIAKFKEWFNTFKETPAVQNFLGIIEKIKEAFANFSLGNIDLTELASSLGTNIANALMSIPDIAIQIGKDVIAGFQNGIKEGISGSIIGDIISFCTEFLAAFAAALGCHSPSVITEEIGVNTIEGFIIGIKKALAPVLDTIKFIGEQIINAFKFIWDLVTDESGNIEWDKMFAGGMLVGGLLVVKQFVDAMKGIADGIGGIGNILEGIGDSFKSFNKVLNAYSWDLKAKAIQKMAVAIAILVGSVYVLTTIDDIGKLWNAVGVIAALAGIVLGMALAMELMSKASITYEKGKLNVEGLKASILQIGATLLMLGIVVKMIGSMNPDQVKQGFIGLTAIMVELIAFMAIVGLVVKGDAGKNIDKVGKLMTKLAFAMILMTLVVKLASGLSPEEMLKGAAFAAAFAIFVIAITKVAKSAGNNVSKVGGMVLKISIAMGLMVGVVKLVSMLSPGEMLKGAAFAAAFVIFVKALVKSTKIGGKQQIAKLGGLLMSISFSMLLMVGVCKLVGMLSVGEIAKGAVFVGAFLIFLKTLIKISSSTSKGEMAKLGSTILALSVAIGILAGVAVLLGMVDIGGLIKGIAAVGILSTFMTMMVKGLKGAQNVSKSIMMLAISIGVMALAVTALSLIDTSDLAASTIALGSLMGMFALMEKSMSGLKNVKAGPILSMIAVIGALAGVIYLLRNVDPESAIGNALALSALLLATSTSMILLDTMNTSAGEAAKAALALTAMAVPLAAFALTLQLMTGIEGAVEKAKALTILAGTATLLALAVVGIGAVIGMTGGAAIVPIVMGLVAMAAPLLVLVGILKLMEGIDGATENVNLLTKMMNTMVKTLTVLAIIGPLALVGVGAMAGLTVLMGAIGLLATGLGALVDKFPGIQKFLDTGLPILEQLADSIGTMIGKFIGGFGEGLSDSLPAIGDNITSFMEKLASASEAASGIDASSFDGVTGLCESLLAVGGTSVGMSIADALVSKFTGDKDATAMEKFETDAKAFFTALKNISGSMTGFALPDDFSSEDVTALLDALKSVSQATVGVTFTDMFTTIMGGEDTTAMEKFETDAKAFFTALKNISGSMSGFTLPEDFSSEDITTLLTTIKSVSTTSVGTSFKDIFTKLIGDEDAITAFETDGIAFFTALKNISGSMTGFTLPEDFSSEDINTLLSALSSVGTQSTTTSFKDMFTKLVGDSTAMEKFETDGKAFFTALKNISGSMSGFSLPEGFSETAITTLLDSIETIGDYGTSSTWSDIFTLGGTSMEKFETDGKAFFKAIKAIADESNGINFGAIPLASMVVDMIKTVIEKTKDIDYSGVANFTGIGTGGMGADGPMHKVAVAIKDFGDTVGGIDLAALTVSISAANLLRNLISQLVGLDTSGLENFKIDSIGAAMKTYGDSVKDIDPSIVASSVTSAGRLRNFIASLVGLDPSGVANFKVGSIGSTIRSYSNSVQEIDVGAINTSISAATKIKNFIAGLVGLDPSGVSNFKPGSIGTSLKSYSSSVAGIDLGAVSNSVAAANKIKDLISGLAGLDTSGVSSFVSSVSTLGSTSIDGLTKAFSGSSGNLSNVGSDLFGSLAKGMKSGQGSITSAASDAMSAAQKTIMSSASAFTKAGSTLMSNIAKGLDSKKSSVSSAVTSAVSSAANKISSYSGSFYINGRYLGDGLVSGINSKRGEAYSAGYALGQAAVQGEKDGQASQSPSKLTIQAGKWLGEGLVIGIEKMGKKVYNTGHDLGDTAARSMTGVVTRISDLIDTGIDSTPTISPVVDLTNVKSSVGAISGMFTDATSSVGVMANLNGISETMNRRNQNGSVNDVVESINKLRKDIDSKTLGNTTYNSIGGVTYDNGSEVSEAIGTLVRALRIEGRV